MYHTGEENRQARYTAPGSLKSSGASWAGGSLRGFLGHVKSSTLFPLKRTALRGVTQQCGLSGFLKACSAVGLEPTVEEGRAVVLSEQPGPKRMVQSRRRNVISN